MDSIAARRAGELIEGILLAPILRPLVEGAGTLGDYEVDSLAREIAHRDERGFAALIASRLAAAR